VAPLASLPALLESDPANLNNKQQNGP